MSEYIEKEALRQFPIRKDHYDKENGDEHFIFGIEAVLEYAENLPAADVSPVVHGRWEYHEDHWECSECKKNPTAFMGFTHLKCDMKYCPNCGTKMDLEG